MDKDAMVVHKITVLVLYPPVDTAKGKGRPLKEAVLSLIPFKRELLGGIQRT